MKINFKKRVSSVGKWFWEHKIISLILLLVCGMLVFSAVGKKHKNPNDAEQKEATVMRRNITNTITGTATLAPKDSYSITSLLTGEIVYDYFEEGDTVKEGDLLYQIDTKDVQQGIDSADISVRRAQDSYNSALKEKRNLTVTSGVSGKVRAVNVKTGDTIATGTPIAQVYDDTRMKLEIPFNASDADAIFVGESATVTITGTGMTVYGNVTKISNTSTAGSGYSLTKTVTIELTNPGAITPEHTATATVGQYACQNAGRFDYVSENTITSKASGKVESVRISAGDWVSPNTVVAQLSSDVIDDTIKQSALSVEEANLARRQARDRLEDYTITAPISGTVVEKNLKAGDNLSNVGMQTTMATIYDMSELTFDLSIDELDIGYIRVGQPVTFTVDALDGAEYKGTVTNVSVNGTTQNGVTVYPITVSVTEFDDRLLPGMNVDASIVVEEAENVLAVPLNAVNRGNVVYVKGQKTEEGDQAPDGYFTREVELGISDDSYIEIKSGLQEGDVVYALPISEGPSDFEKMMENTQRSRRNGEVSGGMSSGGNPGGGNGGNPPGGGM